MLGVVFSDFRLDFDFCHGLERGFDKALSAGRLWAVTAPDGDDTVTKADDSLSCPWVWPRSPWPWPWGWAGCCCQCWDVLVSVGLSTISTMSPSSDSSPSSLESSTSITFIPDTAVALNVEILFTSKMTSPLRMCRSSSHALVAPPGEADCGLAGVVWRSSSRCLCWREHPWEEETKNTCAEIWPDLQFSAGNK